MNNNFSEIEKRLGTLKPNDGFTLKNYTFIEYKTGWQVAVWGKEVNTPTEAMQAVIEYNGNCGVWLSPNSGKYCVDVSRHVKTKKIAMTVGKVCKQETVLRWRDKECIDVIK